MEEGGEGNGSREVRKVGGNVGSKEGWIDAVRRVEDGEDGFVVWLLGVVAGTEARAGPLGRCR